MRAALIILVGLVTAVIYGLASHVITGVWNFSLAFGLGVIVSLAVSGIRSRSVEDEGKGRGDESTSKVDVEGGRGDESKSKVEVERGRGDESKVEVEGVKGEGGNASFNDRSSTPNFDLPAEAAPIAPQFAVSPPELSGEELWNLAREMVHNVIPDPEEDGEYLDLVFSAAELGHVPALAKLGDYAFRRADFVEAYFWTKLAHRHQELQDASDAQALKEIDGMLRSIRREWSAAGQPPEFENVYAAFPEERGELGRAFLRLDSGSEVEQTRAFIRMLAENGNPDAALFANA